VDKEQDKMLNIQALERDIEEQMQVAHVPGLALAVVQDWEVIYSRGFGITSVEDGGLPVTPETLFRIGSITKSMTTTAIMRLVEVGKLDLDRPVRDYVPWLSFSQEVAAEQITLHRLLSHTAGLPTSHTRFGRRAPSGLEEYVRQDVPRYPFVAPPGKLYSYSNPGIRIAGYIAEVVSGQLYTQLMQELVFDPLEMKRTTFDPTVAMTYPLAQSHDLHDDGTLSVQHRYADDTGGYPSGAVISTAMDLTHFAIMQMNHGRFGDRRILSAESVAEMHRIQVDKYTTSGSGYGLALDIDRYKGMRRVGHEGSISTFGSRLVMVPEAGTAVVLLFNRAPGFWTRAEAISDRILDQVLNLPKEAPQPKTIEPDRSSWPLHTGAYLGDWRGLAIVGIEDGQLALNWNGGVLPLSAIREDLYFGRRPGNGETVSVGFIPEAGEPVQYIQVNSSPCQRIQLDTTWTPAPETWQAYTGRYSGVEEFAVRVEDDQLFVYSEEVDREMPCVSLSNTCFACDVGLIEFHVADDGTLPSLRLGKVYTLNRMPNSLTRL
jgi:CubicO group peptidase (beta-lactamase class C family)